MTDFKQIPLRSPGRSAHDPARICCQPQADQHSDGSRSLPTASSVRHLCHADKSEDLSKVNAEVSCHSCRRFTKPRRHDHRCSGSSQGHADSHFKSFGIGLILAVVLVYLILMSQFASFSDPFIILLAIPPGLSGVLILLLLTGTTLNVMSLMGIVMVAGIAVSNSILIVEFVGTLRKRGDRSGKPWPKPAGHVCAHSDDNAGNGAGSDPHGARTRARQRAICSTGTRNPGRPFRFRHRYRLSGSRCLLVDSQERRCRELNILADNC